MTAVARYRTAAEVPPETASALLRFGLALADTKHRMGQRLSEWVNGAPALEAAVAMSAMTQDELGHARALFAMLRDFPGSPPELRTETDLDRSIYYCPAMLEAKWDSWADVIACTALLDQAMTAVFEATGQSAFVPLSQRAAKVLQEEHFHRVFAEAWLARLGSANGRSRERLQNSLARFWAVSASWFGPADDSVVVRLVEDGVLAAGPEALRKSWLERVEPLMQRLGMSLPASALDWEQWDADRRQVKDG